MKVFLIATVCSLIVIIYMFANLDYAKVCREKRLVITATVYTLSLIWWPLLWYKAVGSDCVNNKILISLLWPVIILMFDVYMLQNDTNDVQSKSTFLNVYSNTVCSLTFALAGILAAQFPEKKSCCFKLFMYAVIGCLLFIIPFAHSSTASMEVITLETLQRVSLTFATAFLIAGTLEMQPH